MIKRIKWIDFGKGFFIAWVVMAHAVGNLYSHKIYFGLTENILHLVGDILFFVIMPTFFTISGLLFKRPKSFSEYALLIRKKRSVF